jgi:hypothetical protein
MTTEAKPRRRRMGKQESQRRGNKSESNEKRSASAFKQKDYSTTDGEKEEEMDGR